MNRVLLPTAVMFEFHLPSKTFKVFRRRPVLFITFATLLFLSAAEPAASLDSNIREGIADYNRKNYEQAESNFSKAQKERPDSPELNYNLANSRYKTGKYREALQAYDRAAANGGPPDLKQKSLYNSGNALFRMGKLGEAEKVYKKALEMNSKDMDAKFNLEFVREQIKKNEQKNRNQGSKPDDDRSRNSPEKNDDAGERENSSNPGDQKPSPENKRDAPPAPAEPQELPSSPTPDNSISKDQADHWLSALDENLKKFRKKRAREENPGSPPVKGGDW